MNAVFKPIALPVRPATQDVTIGDDTVVVMLESNRDAETIVQYTIGYTTDSEVTVNFAKTCTVSLISEVSGEVITEDCEPTPEWAHYFICAEVEDDLRAKYIEDQKESYWSGRIDDLCRF